MEPDRLLRVVVADDDPFSRRVIKTAIESANFVVVGEAGNGHEAVALCFRHEPDLVVMDIVMPELDGLLATRRILEERPHQIVVVLTVGGEDEFGLLALRAGALGFISKDTGLERLVPTLSAACAGEGAISRTMTRRVIVELRGTTHGSSASRPIKGPLTPREWEVMDLLALGHSPDHVADMLVVSLETVRSHLKNTLRKLDVHSRADAIVAVERLRNPKQETAGQISDVPHPSSL